MKVVDHHGQDVILNDYVAYATGKRIWVGRVTDLPTYVGDYNTTYKIQINTEQEGGGRRKMTFDFVPDKIYRIGRD